jgi:hypothetical protein
MGAALLVGLNANMAMGQDLQRLGAWKEVLSFRPSITVQRKVRSRGENWATHRIEDAVGNVNVDIYSVEVSKLPMSNGEEIEASEVLEHIRTNLNSFVDTSIAEFRPFDEAEKRIWESKDPTGAVMLIDMKVFGVINPDSGCVVTTRRTRNEWFFSTIRSGGPADLFGAPSVAHPVSGNRAFGVYKSSSNKYVFYTVAADRPTRLIDNAAAHVGLIPAEQKRLWSTFQKKVIDYIKEHGGEAIAASSDAIDFEWDSVVHSEYYDVSNQPDWE